MKLLPSKTARETLVRSKLSGELLANEATGFSLGSLLLVSPSEVTKEIERRERNTGKPRALWPYWMQR